LIHDYEVRLEWDTLLSKACIVDNSPKAGLGVKTLCVGRNTVAGFGMETVYISFDRPRVAAVRMTRGPWFVKDFAASITHQALDENRSRVTYKFKITARPKWLRFVLDPILRVVFQWETRKRLRSLKRFVEQKRSSTSGAE
jgi:hypothetical protein